MKTTLYFLVNARHRERRRSHISIPNIYFFHLEIGLKPSKFVFVYFNDKWMILNSIKQTQQLSIDNRCTCFNLAKIKWRKMWGREDCVVPIFQAMCWFCRIERRTTTTMSILTMTKNYIWLWNSSLVVFGNMKYLFIVIIPRSTLIWIACTCKNPISRSNRNVQSFTKDYYY